MKNLLSIVATMLILATSAAYADQKIPMTSVQQQEAVAQFVLEIHQDLRASGHEFVESKIELYDSARFSSFMAKENNYSEERLDQNEIKDINLCLVSLNCELYKVRVDSECYGGYGLDAHWVLIDIDNHKTRVISQSLYTE